MRLIILALLSTTCVTSAAEPAFPQGQWRLGATASYATGVESPREDIPGLALSGTYYVLDNLAIGLEAGGLWIHQDGSDAGAIHLAGVLRHHVVDFGERSSLYLDVLFGPVEASGRVPGGGTRFNFITRAGVGITHPVSEGIDVVGGLRYFHLSNARIEGDDRNPGINGVEFYMGLSWRL